MGVCKSCGVDKDLSNSYVDKSRKDGLSRLCKQCVKIDSKNRYEKNRQKILDRVKAYTVRNQEKVRQYHKRRYENNKKIISAKAKRYREQNKDRLKMRSRRYYVQHAERIKLNVRIYRSKNVDSRREVDRKYYQDHSEKIRKRSSEHAKRNRLRKNYLSRLWKKHHPESVLRSTHIRRTRMIQNGGSYTIDEWNALCERYHYQCLCCGTTDRLTIDHVIPVSLGGSNSIDNLQPLCLSCNVRKSNRIIDYRHQSENVREDEAA